jgi:hypothetical protein
LKKDYNFYLQTKLYKLIEDDVEINFDELYKGLSKQQLNDYLESCNFDNYLNEVEVGIYRELTLIEENHFKNLYRTELKKKFIYKGGIINKIKQNGSICN